MKTRMRLCCFRSLRSLQQHNLMETINQTCYPCVRTPVTLVSGPNSVPDAEVRCGRVSELTSGRVGLTYCGSFRGIVLFRDDNS